VAHFVGVVVVVVVDFITTNLNYLSGLHLFLNSQVSKVTQLQKLNQ